MAVLYVKHHKTHGRSSSFIRHLETRKTSALIVLFGFLLSFGVLLANIIVKASYQSETKLAQNALSAGEVQGVSVQDLASSNEVNPPPPPSPQDNPPTPTPTKKLSKSYYTIAVIGDSMEDTMGERLEYLEGALKRKYPDTTFFLYNYGVGSENVEEGLAHYNEDFKYKDRSFPSLSKIQADIVVVGSYAYNPFTPNSRDRHWLGLTHLVQEIQKKKDADIYMLAEIAPLRKDFGKGPGGVNWDTDTSYTHSGWIVDQLENVIGLGKTLHVPVIDVYHKSLTDGPIKEGKHELVDTYDGIHPGVKGQEFMAEEIANSIVLK